jgi:hypothetical protein
VNANSTEVVPAQMMQGSSLISTNPPWKVSISMRRSCSIIYSSVITPIFFVECLADLKECSQQEARRSSPSDRSRTARLSAGAASRFIVFCLPNFAGHSICPGLWEGPMSRVAGPRSNVECTEAFPGPVRTGKRAS